MNSLTTIKGAGVVSGHAQLSNMRIAMQTLVDCVEAGDYSPRMGLFYGWSGYGKSVAAAFAAARTGAAYIEAKSVWTRSAFLEALAEELGLVIRRTERTAPKILRQIIDELNLRPRPIIIDEMDHLVTRRNVEIIRDIHDSTSVAIMMIGEETLPAKLKEWERFDNRILAATPAQPASVDDTMQLRNHYCRAVSISDDLALYFAERCRGVTRRIVVNLQAAERMAAQEGVEVIDRAWWGTRPVRTGDIPTRRTMGGA